MAQVYLGLGSNHDRQRYIQAALDALAERFGALQLSSVYESEAIGFDGDPFLNMVVGLETTLAVGELSCLLKRIEDANGRCRDGSKYSGRTLDIDILTYDDCVGTVDGVSLPRDEITFNAFVLQPLAELAGEVRHPQSGRTYSQIWAAYDKERQNLWRVDFNWGARQISSAMG